jgi:hypothetical protein
MLSVGLGSVLKMGSIKMGLDANFEAEGPDRTTFKAMSDSYNVGAHLCEQIFAAVITYTKGLGETHGFNSEELQKYFDGNRACRESVRGAHDLLASTVKQMGSH